MKIKVLTLTQPWATLVAWSLKAIETRSWSTHYRGPLGIHAARSYPPWARQQTAREPFQGALRTAAPDGALPLGCILAVGELTDCFRFTSATAGDIPEPELSFGDFSAGRYGFRLARMRRLATPIPARGSLGLWSFELPEDVSYDDDQ